jgi:phage terminase large subunit-like protein
VLRVDSRGSRLAKEHKHSSRRIDLAVAAVMAFSRAAELPARMPRSNVY